MLYYLWGILASIVGIVVLCNAVRKRKSIGAVLYGTYCSFSLVCIVAGGICMICQQYDELCGITCKSVWIDILNLLSFRSL